MSILSVSEPADNLQSHKERNKFPRESLSPRDPIKLFFAGLATKASARRPSARRLAGGRDPALGGNQAPERAEASGELGGGERREVGEAAEAGAIERPDQPRPDPGQPVEVARLGPLGRLIPAERWIAAAREAAG